MRLTLPLLISHGRVARRLGYNAQSHINLLRNILTGLVRHERIETTWARADEIRFYADKVLVLTLKLMQLQIKARVKCMLLFWWGSEIAHLFAKLIN